MGGGGGMVYLENVHTFCVLPLKLAGEGGVILCVFGASYRVCPSTSQRYPWKRGKRDWRSIELGSSF